MRRLIVLLLCVLSACNLTQGEPPSQPVFDTDEQRLVVAWVEAGNLLVMQAGDEFGRRVASGGVIRPYVAPDGNHIAFTRGPAGVPETLWIVDFAGTAEQELVSEDDLFAGSNLIGDVAWFDDAVLYFNTLRRGDPGAEAQNDLYRANIRTREVALILPRSEGGRFAFSPDREFIVVAYPGTYGRQDGLISVLDPLAQRPARNLLFFVGVATGAEYQFYPELHWLPDSSAVRVAIPDEDLVYSDAEVTTLWNLPVENPSGRSVIGTVEASFFGLPRWSPDGASIVYLQREGGLPSNTFTLFVADSTGENPLVYARGDAGTFEPPQWIPGTNQFLYRQGDAYWIGTPGADPVRLTDEVVFSPQFVDSVHLVFVTPAAVAADGIQFRFMRRGEASSFVGTSASPLPIYHAVLVDD